MQAAAVEEVAQELIAQALLEKALAAEAEGCPREAAARVVASDEAQKTDVSSLARLPRRSRRCGQIDSHSTRNRMVHLSAL